MGDHRLRTLGAEVDDLEPVLPEQDHPVVNELHAAAVSVEQSMAKIPGLVDIKSSSELGNPELQVSFNRDQLMSLGLSIGGAASTIRTKVQGEVATHFTQGDREIDILVSSIDAGRASLDDVRGMIIAQRDGVPIYLGSVAEVKLTEGPSEVRRIGQKRAAIISGNWPWVGSIG